MKTIFVTGKFNVLHIGHLRLFEYAKTVADKLIVGIEGDNLLLDSIHNSEINRQNVINNLKIVDETIIINDSIESAVIRLKPDFVLKGIEYRNLENVEERLINSYGGKLIFFSNSHNLSDELIDDLEQDKKLRKFLIGHELIKTNLENAINSFKKLNICVIGDLIIDEYIDCDLVGLSQEDPAIVVNPVKKKIFVGGAGIVAAHASSMGSGSHFITVTGQDEYSSFAASYLNSLGVNYKFISDELRETTLKKRYRSKGRTLFRVNNLDDAPISDRQQDEIYEYFEGISHKIDALIFSDFNYGCLPHKLVDKLITKARQLKIHISADSQTSSQIGDLLKYKDVTLVTPTEHELRVALRNRYEGLDQLSKEFFNINNPKYIILKLGKNGVIVYSRNDKKEIDSDVIEALNKIPKDTAGAGDSLLIASTLALCTGLDIWSSSMLGSIAASIKVSRVGNEPISDNDLKSYLDRFNFLQSNAFASGIL